MGTPVEALIARGRDHHRQNRLDEAARLYAEALAVAPGHAEALHLSGVLAQQAGDFAGSVALIKTAIAAGPQARYHANLANAFNQLGRFEEAEASAREAIRLDPRNIAAHSNLGVALRSLRRLEAAIDSLHTATTLHPGYAEGFANLGVVLGELGRLAEAEAALRRAVALNSEAVEAWFNLGNTLLRSGRWEEGAAALQEATRLAPGRADAHANLALAHKAMGRLEAAAEGYRTAARLAPPSAVGLHNLGLVLSDLKLWDEAAEVLGRAAKLDPPVAPVWVDLGNALYAAAKMRQDASALPIYDQALAAHRRALAISPDLLSANYNIGLVLMDRGLLEEAVAAFRRATEISPAYAEAHCNLGHCLSDLGRFAEAQAACQQALALNPRLAEAQSTLGNVFTGQNRLQEAEAAYRRAIELNPSMAGGHCNLGVALFRLGRGEEALRAYDEALRLSPDLADAHWNRALVLLQRGDYAEGWQEYDWRLRRSRRVRLDARYDQPLWNGEPLAGRTILLTVEQGLGDAIQCARFIPRVAERGGRVVLEAPRSLHALFAAIPGVERIIADEAPAPPEAVCRLPLFSLPRLVAPDAESLATAGPYLAADPALTSQWGQRLDQLGPSALRIGLVWSGNVSSEVELGRSIPLSAFAALDTPGVRLVSLQKGHGVEQLDALAPGMSVSPLGPDYDAGDFAVTAAVIANLDLVVSCDTSVAHLAGALGQPVWLAVNAVADWRWRLEGAESPWYPSLRIYRQPRAGDWDAVSRAMAAALPSLGSQARASVPGA